MPLWASRNPWKSRAHPIPPRQGRRKTPSAPTTPIAPPIPPLPSPRAARHHLPRPRRRSRISHPPPCPLGARPSRHRCPGSAAVTQRSADRRTPRHDPGCSGREVAPSSGRSLSHPRFTPVITPGDPALDSGAAAGGAVTSPSHRHRAGPAPARPEPCSRPRATRLSGLPTPLLAGRVFPRLSRPDD